MKKQVELAELRRLTHQICCACDDVMTEYNHEYPPFMDFELWSICGQCYAEELDFCTETGCLNIAKYGYMGVYVDYFPIKCTEHRNVEML